MIELGLATLAFVGTHLLMSHGRIRRGLVDNLGIWPHRGLYSLVSFATLGWMVWAYRQAPMEMLYDPHMALRHLPLTVMLMACFFVIGGVTIVNPSAVGMEGREPSESTPGILKITRAPVMWGVGLYAFSHMIAHGDLASWIFFGGLFVLAIGGGWHLDRRKANEASPEWLKLMTESSFIPFAAIVSGRVSLTFGEVGWWRVALSLALYAALLAAHSEVIGVSPIPLP